MVSGTSATMGGRFYRQQDVNIVTRSCVGRKSNLRISAGRAAQHAHQTANITAHAPTEARSSRSRCVRIHSSQLPETGVTKVLTGITNMFPVWVVLGCLSGELQVLT